MGEVYRARDPRLGRDVAVKIISGEGPPSPERLQRFEQEARAVAALQHPHILSVFDVGTHEGRAYLVFELLEGETLRERLSRGPLPARKAIEVAIQAAHGLAAAHAHGILHRDLKPENVVLGHEGVKLLDFGLAKLTEPQPGGEETEATPLATDEGIWVGTPGYVSPEQLRGLPATPRSDVFALGAVLYEMLSGQRAFKGATKADTLAAILEHDPPPMALPGRPVPAGSRQARQAVSGEGPGRPLPVGARRGLRARRDLERVVSESAAAVVPATPTRRWLRAGAALLVAAALAGLGFLGGRRASEKPRTHIQAADLPARLGGLRALRAGRPHGRLRRRLGRPAGRALPDPDRQPRVAPARPRPREGALDLSPGPDGHPARPVTPRGLLQPRHARRRAPRRRHPSRAARERDVRPTGRPTDGISASPACTRTARSPSSCLPGRSFTGRASMPSLLRVSSGRPLHRFRDGGAGKLVLIDRERKVARALVDLGANFWGLAWAPSGREVWFTEGASWAPGTSTPWTSRGGGGSSTARRASSAWSTPLPTAARSSTVPSIGWERWPFCPAARWNRMSPSTTTPSIGALSADGRMLLLNSTSEGAGRGPRAYLRRDGGDPIRWRRAGRRHLSRRELGSRRHGCRGAQRGADRPGAVPEGSTLELSVSQRGAWVPSPEGG